MYLLFVRGFLRRWATSLPEALALAIELRREHGAEVVQVDYAKGWKLCG